MKLSLRVCLAFVAVLAAVCASGQVSTLPVKKINGKLYHYYKVEPKENIYTVSHKLRLAKDRIIADNPSAAEGLKAGMMLYFPFEDDAPESSAAAPSSPAVSATPATPVAVTPDAAPDADGRYTVRRGDTIYGLAKRFGITAEELIAMNPQIKDGLKADGVIRVPAQKPAGAVAETVTPPADTTPVTPAVSAPAPAEAPAAPEGHLVMQGETFYSIAHDYGLTVSELEAANPDVNVLKKGMVLTIPVKGAPAGVPVEETPAPLQPAEGEELAEATAEDGEPEEVDEINIAVVLPFMLGQEPLSKQGQRYTEFYKGFLLAADSLRNSGKAINIKAFDSGVTLDGVKKLIADGSLEGSDVVVAPDNVASLVTLGEWGREHKAMIFNTFLVKDETYLGNPFIMQANLPSDIMYDRAAEGFISLLGDDVPVIVHRTTSQRDKAEFVDLVKKKLTDRGRTFKTIEFDNRLTPADLADLDAAGNYVFLPVTGRQAELNRIMPGLIDWRDRAVTPGVRIFGYPEWTTFRGETLENLHALNATVYSRFYLDEDSYRSKAVDRSFERWYGAGMENAAPRQGMLGFDAGMYLIKLLSLTDSTPRAYNYQGVQSDYSFIPATDGGWYNDALSFITFRRSGVTEKSRVK